MPNSIPNSSFLGTALQKATIQYGGKNAKIYIIGGGIAGLSVGFFLKQAGIDFELHEISQSAGGLLKTHQTPYGIAEQAANGTLYTPALIEMCTALNLPLIPPSAENKNRYIVRNGQLRKIPLSFSEIANTITKLILPQPKKELRTLQEFGQHYLGNAATQYLLNPGIGGIYAADIKNLSYPAILKGIYKQLQQKKSLAKALLNQQKSRPKKPKHLKGTLTFAQGMGQLTSALATYLHQHIHYNSNGQAIINKENTIIFTAPAYATATYFKNHTLSNLLQQVEYNSIISSTVFIKKTALGNNFAPGFGCLIPDNENFNSIGILFNSCLFPNHARVKELETYHSFTCIMRDNTSKNWITASNKQIEALITEDFKRLFNLSQPISYAKINRWPKGIPLYSPQLYNNWFTINQLLQSDYPNWRLFGNYTGKISIREMIQQAADTVESLKKP